MDNLTRLAAGTWRYTDDTGPADPGEIRVADGVITLAQVDADLVDHSSIDTTDLALVIDSINGRAEIITKVVTDDVPVWTIPADEWVLLGTFPPAYPSTVAITLGTLGVTVALPSDRLWEAALLYAIRNVKINDAPLGVAGGFDLGQLYVGRIDEDLNRLLKGYRGVGVPDGQTWPELADLKDRLQITTTTDDVFLSQMLTAAIEQVETDTAQAFGIA